MYCAALGRSGWQKALWDRQKSLPFWGMDFAEKIICFRHARFQKIENSCEIFFP
jgi:hypothetical protein